MIFSQTRAVAFRRRPRPYFISLCLLAGDWAAVTLAVAGSWWAYGGQVSMLNLWLIPALVVGALALFGLYPGYGVGPVEQVRRVFCSVSGVLAALAGTRIAMVGVDAAYLFGVVITWGAAVVLVPLIRSALREALSRTEAWGEPVVLIGEGAADEMVQRLQRYPGFGLIPVGCVDQADLGDGRTLTRDEVAGASMLVVLPDSGADRVLQGARGYAGAFRRVRAVKGLPGVASLTLAPADQEGHEAVNSRTGARTWVQDSVKRTLDLVVGSLLLVVAAPIIGLAALLTKIHSPGPAFYYQEREGLGGRKIRVWKVRTMVINAERALEEYLSQNPAAKREWEQFMKLRNDPRIVPRVGQFFRKSSIDELPQLWNIVKGEMSLVGPRPFPEYHLRQFSPEFRAQRRSVVPGLTGLWQVSARSNGDLRVQEELDRYYVRHRSLWFDFYILARTVWVVLASRGAY